MKQLRIVIVALCFATAACAGSKPPPAHSASVASEEAADEDAVSASDSETKAAPDEYEDERDPRNVVPALPIAPP